MAGAALRAVDLHKTYGSVTALDGLSFTVQAGEIVGLLGPNGAGKTTTINRVLGRTHFAAVYAALPGNLTVNENLRFFGLLYGIRSLSRRVAGLLEEFELVRWATPMRSAVTARSVQPGHHHV